MDRRSRGFTHGAAVIAFIAGWVATLKMVTEKIFEAALNMVLSDGWVLTLGGGNFDPSGRGAHTHHITLRNAAVTPITGGFKINGTATITANGTNNPMVSPSPLEVDIVGGTNVEFSNVTLTFGAPASNHFGTEPLPGVIQRP